MEIRSQDYLKKALLDTQERVRDFMNYADKAEDKKLKKSLKDFAETEGQIARELRSFMDESRA